MRLLVPSSIDRAVTWIDVLFDEDDVVSGLVAVRAGTAALRGRSRAHAPRQAGGVPGQHMTTLPNDPGRITVGTSRHRYAYLPHLLGAGLTLVSLSGANGPELTSVECGFFDDGDESQPYDEGFAVVERACDPETAPEVARDCTRPTLLTTFRFLPAVRLFTVRTGGDDIAGQRVVCAHRRQQRGGCRIVRRWATCSSKIRGRVTACWSCGRRRRR